MNLYHCSIDLKDTSKALAFAAAVEGWMAHLQKNGVIQAWRLCRRKLGFGAPQSRDFLLEIEVENMTQLDQAFRFTASADEDVERLYTTVHQMVGTVDVALYRPFPDPERRERMALI
jgi:DNA-binding Lrp family transcriptional regulator